MWRAKKNSNENNQKNHAKFGSINAVRGFGVNKDKIIWDSGNAVQWIAAKDILVNKFKSEGIYERIFNLQVAADFDLNLIDEIEFEKVLPNEVNYVNEKIDRMRDENDAQRDETLEELHQSRINQDINVREERNKSAEARLKHSATLREINTKVTYKLQNELTKQLQIMKKQKNDLMQTHLKQSRSLMKPLESVPGC